MIEIPLTRDQIAIVDGCDADLAALKWCAQFLPNYSGGGKFAAVRHMRTDGKQRREYLHRAVLSRMLGRPLARHELADHRNGNPLDNRRANLRLATRAENSRNQQRPTNNTSGYKGVVWDKRSGRWRALVGVDGIQKYLGMFDTAEAAAHAYDAVARERHGEFARLNFPESAQLET